MASPVDIPSRHRSQRGVTLIEALVALMVMGFGMVALVGLMGNLRSGADLAKQRGEAMRLAQAELAQLRSLTKLTAEPGDPTTMRYYDHAVSGVVSQSALALTPSDSNATFTLVRDVTPLIAPGTPGAPEEPAARTATVTVAWKNRSGQEEVLILDSIISRTAPSFSGALAITPPTNGVRLPASRNPVIPVDAQDLGNRQSAFRPSAISPTVWVFNNLTGVIVGKCEIPASTPVTALTPEDIETCSNNTVGYLVSGTIRFSNSSPASPTAPEATARPLTVGLLLTPSQFKIKVGGSWVLAPDGAYPITPNHECFSDAPAVTGTTQGFVNYSCIVYPNNQTPRNWWGQVLLGGLDIGTAASQFRVCRYSADYNGNGYTYQVVSALEGTFKIDNEEHPDLYRGVSRSLARQNFLVVRGDVSCPTAPPVAPALGVFADYSTAQLQPAP
jgi:Tfp pilus assembly protein PilV